MWDLGNSGSVTIVLSGTNTSYKCSSLCWWFTIHQELRMQQVTTTPSYMTTSVSPNKLWSRGLWGHETSCEVKWVDVKRSLSINHRSTEWRLINHTVMKPMGDTFILQFNKSRPSKMLLYWLRYWLVACSVPSQYKSGLNAEIPSTA